MLTRSSDNMIAHCKVEGLISDHLAVSSLLRLYRPIRPQISIMYMKLKLIDPDLFRCDMLSMPLFTNPSDEVESLVNQYNTGIAAVLGKHAPLLKKIVTIRPENPWITDDIRLARRYSRQLERRWRLRRLEIDKECLMASRDYLIVGDR